MPVYKAIVEGQDFVFIFDEEPQQLAFHRTIFLEADDDHSAAQMALAKVRHELDTKEMALSNGLGSQALELEDLEELVGKTDMPPADEDFVWFVVDDEADEHEEHL